MAQSPIDSETPTERFNFAEVKLPDEPREHGSRRRRFTQPREKTPMRVFKLFPGRKADTLMGTITIRQDHEDYEALSYYWGEPAKSRHQPWIRILHNDRTCRLNIYPNLEEALIQLRSEEETKTLWVDALCIDQENQVEKSEQISVMDRIFTQARCVRIWLGKSTKESERAMQFVEKLVDLQHFEDLVSEEHSTDWAALTLLMRTPWFSRRWIVQEIAYSRSARIHCGTRDIDWQDMADAVALFASRESEIARLVNENRSLGTVEVGHVEALAANRLVRTVGKVFRKSDDGMGLERLMSLESLVSNLSEFKASHPHDTIYAILSLADNIITSTTSSEVRQKKRTMSMVSPIDTSFAPGHDVYVQDVLRTGTNQLSPPMKPMNGNAIMTNGFSHGPLDAPALELQDRPIKIDGKQASVKATKVVQDFVELMHKRVETKTFHVDYSKPFFEVCKDFVSFAITQSQSLDIICRPWAPDQRSLPAQYRNEYLPSWICQFSKSPFSETYDGNYSRVNAEPLASLPDLGKPPYRAAGTTDACRARFGDRSKNEDPKTLIAPGFILDYVDEMCDPAIEGAVPDEWLEVGGWSNPSELPPDSFWRILVGDRDAEGRNPPPYFRRACKLAFERRAKGGSLNTGQLIQREKNKHMIDFVHRLRAVVFMRRYLKTRDEKLRGLVPKATRRGDMVCVLRGCTVPVILRPVSEDYPDPPPPVTVIPHHGSSASLSVRYAQEEYSYSTPNAWALEPEQFPELQDNATRRVRPNIQISSPNRSPTSTRPHSRTPSRNSGRPTGLPGQKHCLLIGECYIHGMMDGEAFTWKAARRPALEPKTEDFVLH